MAYKFTDASRKMQTSPKNEYVGLMQETYNEQFYNTSDWFTIEEETSFASGIYQNVDVRINGVVDTLTGERVGDDFRKIIFKDFSHEVQLGRMYKFADNYWIVVNRDDTLHTLIIGVTVKRCNNMLRWQDELGALYQVPCSIGYLIKENRDYSTAGSSLVVPSGMIEVQVQSNAATNRIRPNQRFLFGNPSNWIAYRVEGGGVRNFNNTQTLNNLSAGLTLFSMTVDYSNDHADNLTLGIADVNDFIYTLALNQSTISGSSGQQVQLEAIVKLNGEVVTRPLFWKSSNSQVASVNTDGLVTFATAGDATITCSIANNDTVADTCIATAVLSPVDNYQVISSPTVNYVFEGSTQTWTVYLYLNGVQQVDEFSFDLNANTVPSSKYIYTAINGNSFSIRNYGMFLTDTLEITATSGSYSKVINVALKGAF